MLGVAESAHINRTYLNDQQGTRYINLTRYDLLGLYMAMILKHNESITTSIEVTLHHEDVRCGEDEPTYSCGNFPTLTVMENHYGNITKLTDTSRCQPFCGHVQPCFLHKAKQKTCVFRCSCDNIAICDTIGVIIGQNSFQDGKDSMKLIGISIKNI